MRPNRENWNPREARRRRDEFLYVTGARRHLSFINYLMLCDSCSPTSSSPCVDGLTSVYRLSVWPALQTAVASNCCKYRGSQNPSSRLTFVRCLCKLHVITLCLGGQWPPPRGVGHEIVLILENYRMDEVLCSALSGGEPEHHKNGETETVILSDKKGQKDKLRAFISVI